MQMSLRVSSSTDEHRAGVQGPTEREAARAVRGRVSSPVEPATRAPDRDLVGNHMKARGPHNMGSLSSLFSIFTIYLSTHGNYS